MPLLKRFYNQFIRRYLPSKISVHNGIPVRGIVKLFDQTDTFPEYEAPLLRQISSSVKYGDKVVIVGGGLGVSTVAAAHRTVENDSVITYEGGSKQLKKVRETIKLNCVSNQCSVRHAVVGKEVGVYSDPGDANRLSPEDIEPCDVLVLDCEGSEIGILHDLEFTPRTIIVETHGFLDSPESAVQDALTHIGYDIIDREVENPDNGIVILKAHPTE